MLANTSLISIYVVLLFAEHPECQGFGDGPPNITDKFYFAYRLGLSVFSVKFVNSSMINILLRLKVAREARQGTVSPRTKTMKFISDIFQWGLRLSVMVASIVQSDINSSNQVKACVRDDGILAVEAKWLKFIIFA